MQFLHSLGHDLFVACLTLLAAIWAVGMWWGWRAFPNARKSRRVLLSVLWPLAWLVERFAVIQALLAACLLGALVSPQPARADSIARSGSNWVRLTLKPCTDAATVAALQEQGLDPESFRAARSEFGGVPHAACWMPAQGGAVLVYDDKDQGYIPVDALKAVPEA